MPKQARWVQWSCAAAVLLMAVTPAGAKDGRTLWLCDETGCVQVKQVPADLFATATVVVPQSHRAAAAIKPIAISSKPVPIDQLIDLSLWTGVFQ